MAMQIGNLDRRITIEERTTTTDGFGDQTETWSTKKTVWAQELEPRPEEIQAAGAQFDVTSIVFKIRWISWITTKDHRIQYNGKTWDVKGITELGRQDGLKITAQAVQ